MKATSLPSFLSLTHPSAIAQPRDRILQFVQTMKKCGLVESVGDRRNCIDEAEKRATGYDNEHVPGLFSSGSKILSVGSYEYDPKTRILGIQVLLY